MTGVPYWSSFFFVVAKASPEVLLTAIRGVLVQSLRLRGYLMDPDHPLFIWYDTLGRRVKQPQRFGALASSTRPWVPGALMVGWQIHKKHTILAISTPATSKPRAWDTQVEWMVGLLVDKLSPLPVDFVECVPT
jgi:hypothetical protein